MKPSGFTLIELLVVISIISVLAAGIMPTLWSAREKAFYSRALSEMRTLAQAMDMYAEDNAGSYPTDSARNMPVGLERYLASGQWPAGPWPNSVFDWENWDDGAGGRIYQISIRFCPAGGPLSACSFPRSEWANGFDIDSALYYCVSGSCRSHISQPIDYPGKCVNCGN